MSDFVKLYGSILDSSVWATSKDTRLLWITMMAMANRHGVVEASVGGLARRAGLTREECEASLEVLSSPDPDDKSGVDEGRRIRKVDRGWHLTNHAAYRELRTDAQAKTAERVRKHREREKQRPVEAPKQSVTVTPVTRETASNAPSRSVRTDRDRERDQDLEQTPPPKDLSGKRDEPASGVVVVAPQSSDSKVPCPADLELTAGQRSGITLGSGYTDYQVDELCRRFRVKSCADASDLRTVVGWRKCMSLFVSSELTNPRHRPPRAPDEETSEQTRERLRKGPRQPNVLDHSTDEAHARAIGGTVV